MLRFLLSLAVGLGLGLGIGLYVGWIQFPVEYTDAPPRSLAIDYQDDYTVMIAAGYLKDRDVNAALERLRLLEISNIPQYVQNVTERFISSSREVRDIIYMVALAEALGRLTPIMEPYREVNVRGQVGG
jgi:hypothetical protein